MQNYPILLSKYNTILLVFIKTQLYIIILKLSKCFWPSIFLATKSVTNKIPRAVLCCFAQQIVSYKMLFIGLTSFLWTDCHHISPTLYTYVWHSTRNWYTPNKEDSPLLSTQPNNPFASLNFSETANWSSTPGMCPSLYQDN